MKLILAAAVAALVSAPIPCQDKETPKSDPKTLTICAIPDVDKNTLKEDQDRIAKWLSSKIGAPVKFFHTENYAAAVTALITQQADLAWLGGVTFVQASEKSKGEVIPVVTREKDLHFKSYLIANASLNAKTAQDLKGKNFTFGSKSSTSGHVMPRHFMKKDLGIDPETFFKRVAYSGDHTKTATDVESGAADAGVLNYTVFDKLVAEKKVDPAKVKVLWTTPEYVDYCWAARKDLDKRFGAGTLDKIRDAFTSLDPKKADDAALLKIQSVDKYVAAKPEWWDGTKAVLQSIDISAK